MGKAIQIQPAQSVGIQRYLDGALDGLKKFGLAVKEEESPLVAILADVAHLDEGKVLAVSKVLSYESSFNQLVRDNVQEMNVGTRYEQVTRLFDSVVDDAKTLLTQLDDGVIDRKERMQNLWMRLSRGTTHKRFEKIGRIHKGVAASTKEQLDRELAIETAYASNFRFAYQEARTIVLELSQMQEGNLKRAEEEAKTAGEAVSLYMQTENPDQIELARLQTTRDRKLMDAKREDRNYQVLKDFSEGMTNGYNVGEVLIAKLMQTHNAKEQVYRRNVIFFSTNEHVFTTLDAVLTSQLGLHEATQELEAEKGVVNKGLEAVAELGTKLEAAAIKAGYGSTTSPASVQKLVDAVVGYQTESIRLIQQYREESARDSREVEAIVEEGKRRVAASIERYVAA